MLKDVFICHVTVHGGQMLLGQNPTREEVSKKELKESRGKNTKFLRSGKSTEKGCLKYYAVPYNLI